MTNVRQLSSLRLLIRRVATRTSYEGANIIRSTTVGLVLISALNGRLTSSMMSIQVNEIVNRSAHVNRRATVGTNDPDLVRL